MWKPHRTRKQPECNELVLGERQAAARHAETAHRAAHDGNRSPLKGARYEAQAELSLLLLIDAGADDTISEVASRYRDAGPSDRCAITASLTMDDFRAITFFVRRSAARALASSQVDDLADALAALAMIASDRIDPRAISWAAAYVGLAGMYLAEPRAVDELFVSAANIAESGTSAILRSFAGSSYDDVRAGWLVTVVEHGGRNVIVETDGGRFEPNVDLLALAVQLQQILESDGYLTGDPVIGSGAGFRWLKDSIGSTAILERSVASVGLRVAGRPDSPPMEQLFLAYVYDLASADDTAEFTAVWRHGERDFASLAVSVGRLLVLFISRSSIVGVPTIESDTHLRRFDAAVREVLSRAR